MQHLRKTVIAMAVCLLLLPASMAGQQADTVFTFRFVAEKDMFFVPYDRNQDELENLLQCIRQHQETIRSGQAPVYVDGHSTSAGSEADNLAIAKIRSNRVKSELIIQAGLTESCFSTRNHATDGNYVTVRISIPAPAKQPQPVEAKAEPQPQPQPKETAEQTAVQQPAEQASQAEPTVSQTPKEAQSQPDADKKDGYHLAVRANLLRWATLTPDLGIEWRINRSWGIAVNGTWTSWRWDNKNRRYALWEVAPELRYYLGKKNKGYLGALYKAGAFNYKLGETGKQGDLMGGGLTGGYQLKLNKALSLDFHMAIGCLHADYDKYAVIEGTQVKYSKDSKNWWGPINAGVTLVWKLF